MARILGELEKEDRIKSNSGEYGELIVLEV